MVSTTYCLSRDFLRLIALMMFILIFVSDECGMGYCQDCEPTFVDACQYCDKKYCGDCSQYMYICQGEGCNRANCNKGECFDDNKESVKCVWMYKGHRGDEEHDLFCVDCYEKACARAKVAMATF